MRPRTGFRIGHQVELPTVIAVIALLIGVSFLMMGMIREGRWPQSWYEWLCLICAAISVLILVVIVIVGIIRDIRRLRQNNTNHQG